MKKKISLLLAAAIMIISSVSAFADEQTQQLTLTLDTAIEYALANSPKIEKAQTELDKSKHSENQARRTYNEFSSSGSSFDEALVESGYAYRAAQIQSAQAERNLESEKNSLKTTVKKNFYTYLNSKSKILTAQTNLENAKQKYEHSKTRYEQGTISRLELKSFELAVTNAQNSLNQAERTSELSLIDLRNTLNVPEDTAITISGEFTSRELTYADAATAVELAKEQNSFLSINEGRELASMRFKIAGGWYSINELNYSIEKATYANAMAGFADSENTLKYNIASLYSNILTLKETVSYLNEYTDLLRENTEASYLQYELGMITSNEYIETAEQYFTSQNNLIDAELNYYITVLEYVTLYSGSADIA